MSNVTSHDHRYKSHIPRRDSKFVQIELFFSKKSLFVMTKLEKNFFCIDLSKYRLITNFLEFFAYDL